MGNPGLRLQCFLGPHSILKQTGTSDQHLEVRLFSLTVKDALDYSFESHILATLSPHDESVLSTCSFEQV